jgi:hypothetical protein
METRSTPLGAMITIAAAAAGAAGTYLSIDMPAHVAGMTTSRTGFRRSLNAVLRESGTAATVLRIRPFGAIQRATRSTPSSTDRSLPMRTSSFLWGVSTIGFGLPFGGYGVDLHDASPTAFSAVRDSAPAMLQSLGVSCVPEQLEHVPF